MNRWLKALIPGLLIASLLFFFYKQKANKSKRPVSIANKKGKKTWKATYTLLPDLQKEYSTRPLRELLQSDSLVLAQRTMSAGLDVEIKIDDKRIIIVVPRITDTADLSALFTLNQSIGFWETYNLGEMIPVIKKIQELDLLQHPVQLKNATLSDSTVKPEIKQLLNDIHKSKKRDVEQEKTIFHFDDPAMYVDQVGQPTLSYVRIIDSAKAGKIIRDPAVMSLLPPEAELLFGEVPTEGNQSYFNIYALKNHRNNALPPVGESDLEFAEANFTPNSYNPEVTMKFNHLGTRKWAKLTVDNVKRYIAITLNDHVISAPVVNSPITGGTASISGGFQNFLQASILAAQLKSGRLTLPLVVKSKKFELNHSNRELWRDILVFAGFFLFLTGLSYFVIKQLETR